MRSTGVFGTLTAILGATAVLVLAPGPSGAPVRDARPATSPVHSTAPGASRLPAVPFPRPAACVLEVPVTDAETGDRLDHRVRIVVLDLSTGRTVVAARGSRALRRWMDARGLRPGTYCVLVEGAGYMPFAETWVDLARPGARRLVDARLEPLPR